LFPNSPTLEQLTLFAGEFEEISTIEELIKLEQILVLYWMSLYKDILIHGESVWIYALPNWHRVCGRILACYLHKRVRVTTPRASETVQQRDAHEN
jgi:hypothetical protein